MFRLTAERIYFCLTKFIFSLQFEFDLVETKSMNVNGIDEILLPSIVFELTIEAHALSVFVVEQVYHRVIFSYKGTQRLRIWPESIFQNDRFDFFIDSSTRIAEMNHKRLTHVNIDISSDTKINNLSDQLFYLLNQTAI